MECAKSYRFTITFPFLLRQPSSKEESMKIKSLQSYILVLMIPGLSIL